MTTKCDTSQVHDLALEMFRHLQQLEDSPDKEKYIFRMICAVERSAAGLLDEARGANAMEDVEAAALFCQSA